MLGENVVIYLSQGSAEGKIHQGWLLYSEKVSLFEQKKKKKGLVKLGDL